MLGGFSLLVAPLHHRPQCNKCNKKLHANDRDEENTLGMVKVLF